MSEVVFRRIHGRIIPIRKSKGPNKGLAALSLGAEVLSGVVSGLTISGGARKIILGQSTSSALEIGSSVINAAAHKDMGKGRAKSFAKHQVINSAVGYSVFGATILAHKPSREAAKAGIVGALNLLRKVKL
jgi:hypothetical protein